MQNCVSNTEPNCMLPWRFNSAPVSPNRSPRSALVTLVNLILPISEANNCPQSILHGEATEEKNDQPHR